jgi:hypothetical protein
MKDQNFGENCRGILVYESFEFDFMCEAVEFAKQSVHRNVFAVNPHLTLCRSNLNPYCLGRKAAFFSVGI